MLKDLNARVLIIHDLEEAKRALQKIEVDRGGIEIMGPKAIHRVIKLEGVDVRAANIVKQEMLALGGEAAISKDVYYLDKDTTDVILMGTLKQFKQFYQKLLQQPFGLSWLAEQVREVLSHFESRGPVLKIGRFSYDLAQRTHIMGVLNVTPDSFSDGGKFLEPTRALSQAIKMVEDGADIIDIGGESTRPGAESVSIEQELERVIPVIRGVHSAINKPISIDTYKAEVAREAIEAGASMVNDITGLRGDREMVRLVAEKEVPVVIMHMKGTPRDMQDNPQYVSVMGEITAFLRERIDFALKSGVQKERIVIDPGIGFGKTVEHNLEILHHLEELKSLGYPLLIGTSRKSFIGLTLDLPVEERLEGTAATVAYAIAKGVNIVRVHDVKEIARVVRMTDAMERIRGTG